MKKKRNTFGAPLPWFLLAGVALFVLDSRNDDNAERPIEISAGDIQRLQDQWHGQTGREATKGRLDLLIDELVLERRLAREARALGLDEDDVIIQRRLAQKLKFLSADLADNLIPDEQTLQAYFADHREEYREANTLTFRQVFLSREKRGDRAESEALHMLSKLQQTPDVNWRSFGDPGVVGRNFVNQPSGALAKSFGAVFVDQLMQQQSEGWQGPLQSDLGLHLVFVEQLMQAPLSDWPDVREQVLYDYRRAQRTRSFAHYVKTLERKYPVVVAANPDVDIVASAGATK